MKLSLAIESMENIIDRLNADFADKALVEVEALDWAIGFIKNKLARTIVIIGHPDFVDPFLDDINSIGIDRVVESSKNDYVISKVSEDLVTVVIYDATDFVLDLCQQAFNPDGLDGNLLVEGRILDYLICHRYFLTVDIDDSSKKVMFLHLSVRNEFVPTSASELITWAKDIFTDIDWDG